MCPPEGTHLEGHGSLITEVLQGSLNILGFLLEGLAECLLVRLDDYDLHLAGLIEVLSCRHVHFTLGCMCLHPSSISGSTLPLKQGLSEESDEQKDKIPASGSE